MDARRIKDWVHFLTLLTCLLIGLFFVQGTSSQANDTPSSQPSLSLEERGARHGQALAAAEICPGAKLTPKVELLAENLRGQDLDLFLTHSKKVVLDWKTAFGCKDVDPAQTRDINGCRRAKILSCSMTWQEIGPEGTALPGLLEFNP